MCCYTCRQHITSTVSTATETSTLGGVSSTSEVLRTSAIDVITEEAFTTTEHPDHVQTGTTSTTHEDRTQKAATSENTELNTQEFIPSTSTQLYSTHADSNWTTTLVDYATYYDTVEDYSKTAPEILTTTEAQISKMSTSTQKTTLDQSASILKYNLMDTRYRMSMLYTYS